MTSVRKLLERMPPERARLLRAHARGAHRMLWQRSCLACRGSVAWVGDGGPEKVTDAAAERRKPPDLDVR
jgi:hypothetical protein